MKLTRTVNGNNAQSRWQRRAQMMAATCADDGSNARRRWQQRSQATEATRAGNGSNARREQELLKQVTIKSFNHDIIESQQGPAELG